MPTLSSSNIELRQRVQAAVLSFDAAPLRQAALGLLRALGYASDKVAEIGTDPEEFLSSIEEFGPVLKRFDRTKLRFSDWKSCAFVFQLTNDEIPSLVFSPGQVLLGADKKVVRSQIESFVFLAIELKGGKWSRSDLALITREINRRFPMPAIIIFHHGDLLSVAVIDRRASFKDSSVDVIDDRITVIKDIRIARPHRAHLEILASLALESLGDRQRPSNFADLYKTWIEALSTQALNKRFYTELAWWYFWAVRQVEFPLGGGQDPAKRHSVAVIRLLTRLIFIWFIKEKGLVPEGLFDRQALKRLLKSDPSANPEACNYYRAVLQNLFFATLNVEMGSERRWAVDGGGMKADRLIHSLYRHKELFSKPESALHLFSTIPYLNGGLFECLDRDLTERDFERNPELKQLASKEGNGWVLRIDGFSRRPEAQPKVPNKLFFDGEEDVDLSAELGSSKRLHSVDGLFDLFNRYKFTVDENTPIEEEVALDPELLGKVFENLLASYNEDTRITARKLSGSFYTPREVVNYMVDEALVAALELHLSPASVNNSYSTSGPEVNSSHSEDVASRLRTLLSYGTYTHDFSYEETTLLIAGIESLKILDPACGSGAFPMGALAKLVHVLRKLDPNNALWRKQNRKPLDEQLALARKIPDPSLREDKVLDAEEALRKLDRDFSNAAHADYTRKLYLIEKCIHGVDLQPIAVQIAKLRFFISLIVSQEVNEELDNWGITALPNLETKIVAADSLTPIDRPKQLPLRDAAIGVKEQELVAANEYYFAARSSKTKRKWRDCIFDLRDELARMLEEDLFLPAGAASQLVHWNPFDQNSSAKFFDPEWMFQVANGFDVVIGNPPYVRQEQIETPPKTTLKEYYECYTGVADLFVYFYERSIRLLKPNGAFAFITSNKWYKAKYGEKLRDWMSRNSELRIVIDFGDAPVFDAIAYPTIVIATRRELNATKSASRNGVRTLTWIPGPPIETFPAVFARDHFVIPQSELKIGGWQLEPKASRLLLERILNAGTPLREYVGERVFRGITTGYNDAFEITNRDREDLIRKHPSSHEVIKPYLRSQDVARWKRSGPERWIVFTRRGIDIRKYPGIQEYLRQFKTQLTPKPDNWDEGISGKWPGRKAGNYKWYEIQDNIAYWEKFESAKIVSTKVSIEPTFLLDLHGHYIGNTAYFLPASRDPLFLLAILNSTVSRYFSKSRFVGKQNGYYEVQPEGLEEFPIPPATAFQREALATIGSVLTAREDSRFEQLINGLVFELFFANETHSAGVHLFDAIKKAGIQLLTELDEVSLQQAADQLATKIFANSHTIYAMLFNLQSVDVVRMIEGRE